MTLPYEALLIINNAGPCGLEGHVSHIAGSVMVSWTVEKQMKKTLLNPTSNDTAR